MTENIRSRSKETSENMHTENMHNRGIETLEAMHTETYEAGVKKHRRIHIPKTCVSMG